MSHVIYKLEPPDTEYYTCLYKVTGNMGPCGGPLANPKSFVCDDCTDIFDELVSANNPKALAIEAQFNRERLIKNPDYVLPDIDKQFGNMGKDEF